MLHLKRCKLRWANTILHSAAANIGIIKQRKTAVILKYLLIRVLHLWREKQVLDRANILLEIYREYLLHGDFKIDRSSCPLKAAQIISISLTLSKELSLSKRLALHAGPSGMTQTTRLSSP